MKKIFLIISVVNFLIFAFFIPQLNAQAEPPPTGTEPVISMDFKDASLKDILKAFSIQSGMNFIASEAVQDRAVTLYLSNVPLTQAMDKIFSANNLSYVLDKDANIYVVKEWGKMGIETVTKVFYLKNASVTTSAFKADLLKNATEKNATDSSDSSSSTTLTGGKWKIDEESGITSAVKKLLTVVDKVEVGSVMEDYRTNSLIVTDTPAKIIIISQVIASLDIAVPQVMLEVEMLDVNKNVVDKVGFEFGDTPFTAILTGAAASTGFPYAGWGKLFSTNDGNLAINTGSNTYQMQLDFIRTQTDTKYLARPKLLTLNNETAEIAITKDEIVGREDTTVYNSGGTPTTTSIFKRSTDLKLSKEGTGIFLRVTPQINLDANEITMVVNPKSSVTSISDLSVTGNQQADVEVRSTKSIVKVKDGETVILGGLIHLDKAVAMKKLPILGDIPLIGALFRHKEQSKAIEREILVFITPRIIRDKVGIKLNEIKNIQLPIREQGAAFSTGRNSIINSNMNKFD
ncbi:MAG: hypothetical protein COV71_01210, partial [Candidatus Omnitrophica bacterium CG11_big_fil_rev_8_21_14_0_20_41_12]